MTVLAPQRPAAPEKTPRAPGPVRSLVTAALASSAAAWMASGLFIGTAARGIALGGVALGVGLVALSLRTRRGAFVQYLVLPVSALIGALLVLPDTSGTTSLQSLVADAVREGGLAQPPVPLDPGWRFLLLVISSVLSAAAASFALAIKPAAGITLALPVVIAAGIVQPEGAEVVGAAVALGLLLAALTVSSGEDLGPSMTRGLEVRRLARGAAGVLGLAVVMIALSRAGFLFPDATSERVVPAQRPPVAGPQPDRVLFTVEADTAGPWRLGVLDIYDGAGWLLPPLDPARLQDIPASGEVRDDAGAPSVRATFTVADLPGRVLPGLAEPLSVRGLQQRAQLDPRTATIRLPEGRADEGIAYSVTAPGPPSGQALAQAPPPGEELAPFLEAPQPPNEIVALLADAPENTWDRLVFLRASLYANVIAAGAGDPVDVPPARAVELLAGAEATPFEITATEALLARWAGVPSRIGFGFFSGDTTEAGPLEVRPKHGATWLEVAFEGHGWVPIVGIPPRARASLSPEQQRADPNVRATDELALIVHIPIRLQTVRLLFVTVRYWLTLIVPPLVGVGLIWWLAPGVLKLARDRRRRRWAHTVSQGARARILVAYARFRDAATDFGIGEPTLTPLAFVRALEADDEHTELAWLVTRGLWGDLRRALDDGDAEEAERMARSLTRRLRRAHPPFARVLAFGSRASLRAPYAGELPSPRLRPRVATTVHTIVLALALGACVRAVEVGVGPPGSLPARAAPDRLGSLVVQREPIAENAFDAAGDASLVHRGRIYTLRDGRSVEGYLELAAFRGGVDAAERDVRDAILRSIGAGTFRLQRLGDERAWIQEQPELRMLLAFAPDGRSMTMLVARRSFARAEQIFVSLLQFQRGETEQGPAGRARAAYDPRKGISR